MAAVVLAVLVLLVPRVEAQLDGAGFDRRDCARCHGAHGRGDGPDVAIFTSPPRNLRTEFLGKSCHEKVFERVRGGRDRRCSPSPPGPRGAKP